MILDLYLGRAILRHLAIVLAVLLGLFSFVDFIDQLGDLGVGDYDAWQVIRFVVLSMPYTLYELLPVGALLGTVLALSSLASGSELVALRAAGVSLARITGAALKTGLVIAAFAVVLGEFVSPATETMARDGRAAALQQTVSRSAGYGLWMRDRSGFVSVGEILPDLTLLNVRIFDFDEDARLRSLSFAAAGRHLEGGWELYEVRRTVIRGDEGGGVAAAGIAVSPAILRLFLIDPDQMSVWQLRRYVRFLRDNGQRTDRFELAFWNRVLSPLSIGAMIALAVPFVFGSPRAHRGGRDLFVGVMAGLVFHAVSQSLGYMVIVLAVSPIFGALLPLSIFTALAVLLHRRAAAP